MNLALSSITSYPSTVGVMGRSSQLCRGLSGVSGRGELQYSTDRSLPLSLARVTGLEQSLPTDEALCGRLALLSARGARSMGSGTGTNGVAIAPHGQSGPEETVCSWVILRKRRFCEISLISEDRSTSDNSINTV